MPRAAAAAPRAVAQTLGAAKDQRPRRAAAQSREAGARGGTLSSLLQQPANLGHVFRGEIPRRKQAADERARVAPEETREQVAQGRALVVGLAQGGLVQVRPALAPAAHEALLLEDAHQRGNSGVRAALAELPEQVAHGAFAPRPERVHDLQLRRREKFHRASIYYDLSCKSTKTL